MLVLGVFASPTVSSLYELGMWLHVQKSMRPGPGERWGSRTVTLQWTPPMSASVSRQKGNPRGQGPVECVYIVFFYFCDFCVLLYCSYFPFPWLKHDVVCEAFKTQELQLILYHTRSVLYPSVSLCFVSLSLDNLPKSQPCGLTDRNISPYPYVLTNRDVIWGMNIWNVTGSLFTSWNGQNNKGCFDSVYCGLLVYYCAVGTPGCSGWLGTICRWLTRCGGRRNSNRSFVFGTCVC